MPAYATLFLLTTLSSIGLPLMNGFVGEFLILNGAFRARAIYGVLAATGIRTVDVHRRRIDVTRRGFDRAECHKHVPVRHLVLLLFVSMKISRSFSS